jgi:hypothetical protein
MITDPLVDRTPSGVTITWPPCTSGENLPKLSCDVSSAVKDDTTSANACAETLAWLKAFKEKDSITIKGTIILSIINQLGMQKGIDLSELDR